MHLSLVMFSCPFPHLAPKDTRLTMPLAGSANIIYFSDLFPPV